MSPYHKQIVALVATTTCDPRHIEAYMRLEHSTLDALSPRQFMREVRLACLCVDEGGKDSAERLAKSFGL
jgi:hypothetical protein